VIPVNHYVKVYPTKVTFGVVFLIFSDKRIFKQS